MSESSPRSCDICPSSSMSANRSSVENVSAIKSGRTVRIKTLAQIMATLDQNGTTEGLPFMPEMAALCGHDYVARPADRVCLNGFRRLDRVFHLGNTRCSGSAHDACGAGCLLFWHQSWLEAVEHGAQPAHTNHDALVQIEGMNLSCVDRATGRYICQATTVGHLGTTLPVPGPVRLLGEFIHGRMGLGEFNLVCNWAFNYVLLHTYGALHRNRRSTPKQDSNLQIGELVRVKGRLEILGTLDTGARNRGLRAVPDMLRYCGKVYRITGRVDRIIEPETGEMREMKNECIVLDGVTCYGGRSLCSRRELFFWRDAWLKRVSTPD